MKKITIKSMITRLYFYECRKEIEIKSGQITGIRAGFAVLFASLFQITNRKTLLPVIELTKGVDVS